MADFVLDSLTDTAGTLLSAHTPEQGGAWTRATGNGHTGNIQVTAAGRIRPTSNVQTRYYNAASPPSADYAVRGTFYVATLAGAGPNLIGRAATVANTGYLLAYSVASTRWELYKVVANTYTLLGSHTQTLTVGLSYLAELAMVGTAITAYIDGVSRIAVTDSAVTAAGQAAVRFAEASPSDSANILLADFAAGDVIGDSDVTAPTVSATNPAASATGVAVSVSPTVTFSEAMDAATMTDTVVRVKVAGSPVAASVSYDAGSNTATVNPDSNLPGSTVCTIEVTTGAEDAAGNALASTFSATFTTAAVDSTPPTVTGATPASGATGVSPSVSPTVTFSEAMDEATLTSSTVRVKVGGSPVAANLSYDSGTHVVTIDPVSALPGSTACTIEVTTGVTDVAGNALAGTFTQSFTTASALNTIGYDYFNGTDGSPVAARPSTSGHTWTAELGALLLFANQAYWGGASAARLILGATPPGVAYDIYAEIYPSALTGKPQIYARWAGGTGYHFAIDPARRRVEFYVSGSFTAASADNTVPLTVGQITTIKVQIKDATKKVFVATGALITSPSFTEIFSSTNNAVTQVGKAGVGTNNGSGLAFETLVVGETDFVFAPDTTPPVVTRGTVTALAGQTSARADVLATANESAQFRVRWGTSPGDYTGGTTAYGAFVTGGVDATIPVTGLPGGGTIHYVVDALDAAGNSGTSSAGSFVAPANDTTPPSVGAVVVTPAGDGSSLTFAFTTSEGANATVQVGTASGVYPLAASDSAYPTSHSIQVAGTQSGVGYFYRVVATDAAGNSTTTAPATFANPAIVAATITRCRLSRQSHSLLAEVWYNADDNASMVATTRYKKHADATWRTGLPLERQVGTDGYGRMMVNFLANLDADTSYDLEVTLTDADGVTASAVPLYTNEVTVGTATIANTSGTVKTWTATVSTIVDTLPAVGTVTHYISPSGSDTTGDGTSGTPWRTMAKAALATPATATVVQMAAGEYTCWNGLGRTAAIIWKAATPAAASSNVTVSGRTRVKPVAANGGSRAVIVPTAKYTPTGSGLPNAGLWTSVDLTGPATGATYQVWKLANLPTSKLAQVVYGATAAADPYHLNRWASKPTPFTPGSGPYAGLTFNINSPAGWAEVLYLNGTYAYGWISFTGDATIYARFPNGVDPNTQFVYVTTAEDGAGTGIVSPGVRYSGVEFRVAIGVGTGAVDAAFDRCLFNNVQVVLSGTRTAWPHTRGKGLVIEECVHAMRRSTYDPDPAQNAALGPWGWIKGDIGVSGVSASSAGWRRVGDDAETTAIRTIGGTDRAIVRRCAIDGFFNGFGGNSQGYDRFTMYHNEVIDCWFEHIADDCLEPEQAVFGLLVIDPIARDSLTFFSISPANYGPVLVKGAEVFNLTYANWGGPAGARGGSLLGIKYGTQHNQTPHTYWWHNTLYLPEAGTNGGLQANNGTTGQLPPWFHFRNSVFRATRYALQTPSWAEEDYNDLVTTDPTRGINVNSTNKTTVDAYRLAMTNAAGHGLHSNLRSEDFHVDSTPEFVDAASGDFRLAADSAFIGAGLAVPYWDRPGTDFLGATPDLGAVQQFVAPPPDTTPPTVTATTPAAGAAQVPIAASPTVTFSEPMDAGTITTSTVRVKVAGNPVAAAVSYDATTRTATIDPNSNLAFATACVIEVTTGAEDAAGNAIAAAFTATFTTVASPDATPPVVVGVSPGGGATGVAVVAVVAVTFSEPLDPATVTAATVRLLRGGTPVAVAVGYVAGGVVATLDPQASLLESTTYTVEVGTGVTDVAGNALAVPFSSSFVTTVVTPTDPGIGRPRVGATTLTIEWESDNALTTQLAYGPTPALGFLTEEDTELTFEHEVELVGVTPGARFFAQTLGVDSNGVADESEIVALVVPGRRRRGLLRI